MNIFNKIFQEIEKRKPSKIYNKEIFDKTLKYQKIYGFEIDLNSKNPMWDNEADAFKHAFFSADLAYRFNSLFSKILGDKHERDGDRFNNQPFGEKNMDFWNNSVGRRIGVELKQQIKESKQKYSREQVDDMIAKEIMKKMQNEALITNPNDPRKYIETKPLTNLKGQVEENVYLKDFSKLTPAKLDELKNPAVQGISGNVSDAAVASMNIVQPQPVVLGANTASWLGKLGSVLSGVGNLMQLGVNLAMNNKITRREIYGNQ